MFKMVEFVLCMYYLHVSCTSLSVGKDSHLFEISFYQMFMSNKQFFHVSLRCHYSTVTNDNNIFNANDLSFLHRQKIKKLGFRRTKKRQELHLY